MTRQRWEDLRRRAAAGDAEAQWAVGAWLEDGLADPSGTLIVRRNVSAAVRWYRRSAEAGHASAQLNLGNCLSSGRGVRRDDAEALRWYRRALRQGLPCAASNIATVYRDQGDERRAMLWYRRASAGGDGDAWVEVGRRCYEGIGVRPDVKGAVRCFRRAIASRSITQAGREEAMYRLGVAHHEGRGARRSDALARQWLRRSNRDNDRPEARALLAAIRNTGA